MSQKLVTFSLTVLLTFLATVDCQGTFDFIVVGSGAGGGTVARRLVENGRYTVLLIESGGWPKEGYDVPATMAQFYGDPSVTFRYRSVPQRNASLHNNGVVNIFAGRMLGGTTSLNAMWFNRGHPQDWNNWANLTGDSSWRYENMLKYFRKSENYLGDYPSAEQHGISGPITVSRPRFAPGLDNWLNAGRELGYLVGDANGPEQRGFASVEYSKFRGRRVGSLVGYLGPVSGMQNLQVLINTNVTNIIFNGNRATGVNFVSPSTSNGVAYATKEVIISAGAYNSPLILQRSGIGPRYVLQHTNIPILRELPVGENFQNHPAVNLNFIINNASAVLDEGRDLTPESLQLFNTIGDGPYSNNAGATGQAFISSSVAISEGNTNHPDIQLCMSHSTQPYFRGDNLHTTITPSLRPGEVQMSSSVWLGRPKSRGSVHINPADILGHPVVDTDYLTDPRDLQIFLDGVQETLRVFEQTNAYRSLGARYAPVVLPACSGFPVRSYDYWVCYIRQVIQGGCHPAGTNKMGASTDPTAVVDSELRVLGTDGLRVVDASIMPFITNANPQAAVYAIAEKAAEMILRRWEPALPIIGNKFLRSLQFLFPNQYPQTITTTQIPLVQRRLNFQFNVVLQNNPFRASQSTSVELSK